MIRVVSATEVRIRFGEMIQRVNNNQETIIVERFGEPQIVLLSLIQYQRLKDTERTRADWWKRVDEAREQIARDLNGAELKLPEEVIRRMRDKK